MPWPKGKSRGSRCNVCKRYFKPHGLGPHMTSHQPKKKEKKAPDIWLADLLVRAAALRVEADEIEATVRTMRRLQETYST